MWYLVILGGGLLFVSFNTFPAQLVPQLVVVKRGWSASAANSPCWSIAIRQLRARRGMRWASKPSLDTHRISRAARKWNEFAQMKEQGEGPAPPEATSVVQRKICVGRHATSSFTACHFSEYPESCAVTLVRKERATSNHHQLLVGPRGGRLLIVLRDNDDAELAAQL